MNDPLSQLQDRIARSDSMIECLRVWCDEFGVALGAMRSDHAPDSGRKPAGDDAMDQLRPQAGESVVHRGVTLFRGDADLLDADSWYIPERLPEAVNKLLTLTDTPFAEALPSKGQTRQTVLLQRSKSLRDDVEGPSGEDDPTRPMLTVQAVITLDGVPVCFVEERLHARLVAGIAQSA